MTTLPTLYKLTGKGSLQQWRVWVEDSTICTEHGKYQGKLQVGRDTVKEGKNAGKVNETTAQQQAEAEAQSLWNKKVERSGYVAELERAQSGETNIAGGIAPMLAKTFEDINPRKIRWPYHGQRKLNGLRCLVEVDDGVVTLWSRRRNIIKGAAHIRAAYKKVFAKAGLKGRFIFDGELYRHGWSLQKISGLVRDEASPEDSLQLVHNVYDFPISDLGGVGRPWSHRLGDLEAFFAMHMFGIKEVVLVETLLVEDEAQMKIYHDQFVQEGYEGIILRAMDGPYEPDARSYFLIKYKEWIDLEFTILGVGEGRGKFEGLAVFNCVTKVGRDEGAPQEFDCSAPGGFKDRERYLKNADKVIGKGLTVKFFEWTDKFKPVFPVGVVIRDYE